MAHAFRPATLDDLPMLRRWQAEPHVREWWSDDEPFDAADLADSRVCRWIVSHDRRPFAFRQDYDIHGWGAHPLDALPPGSRGIDQYVGDPAMTGQGHGPAFIARRIAALLAEGAPAIGTDPHPGNARAIRVYQGLGFRVLGPERMTDWGLVLPMALWADQPQSHPIAAVQRGSAIG